MSFVKLLPKVGDLPWPPMRWVLHWTAGTNEASAYDLPHYHFLIEGDGGVVVGKPHLRNNCKRAYGSSWAPEHADGYAAHCRGLNSWSGSISLCGMTGAEEKPFKKGSHPITEAQTESLITLVTEACGLYGLLPTVHRVMTHEEVHRVHGVKQAGKWDIRWLPKIGGGVVTGNKVGPYIRSQVAGRMR